MEAVSENIALQLEQLAKRGRPPLVLGEQIGAGGFGTVRKAQMRNSGEVVAVKMIAMTEYALDSALVTEIKHMKACSHKNIVKYHNSHIFNKKLYIIMEFLDGLALSDVIYKFKFSLPEDSIAAVMEDCLKGLEHLHQLGLIHNDIKSFNIMVTKNGTAKLIDLGLSVPQDPKPTVECGSLTFLAPEIVKGEPYNESVDIWALGITLIELIDKEPPYQGLGRTDKRKAIVEKRPEIKTKENASLECQEFIAFCLTIIPHQRPSAGILLEEKFIKKAAERERVSMTIKNLQNEDEIEKAKCLEQAVPVTKENHHDEVVLLSSS